ncbi:serine protease Do [Sinobacterium caligoides]|uniref:Probable periplasmic serine endoprotease DegP-like n=1 Tax=Sinobacterium caligoides TaxID=933926 RepID=A0A3N2DYZ5_9GAMM|nr:serine protease Do [Sinobacterium caligoides]
MRLIASMPKLVVLLCALFTFTSVQAGLPEFTGIVEDNAPAVVKINTLYKGRQGGAQLNQVPRDDVPEIFRRLFEQRQPQPRSGQGLGSGFIVSSDGYILTNNHVVDGADSITVRMTDRSEYDAKVIGVDPRSDLALLKVEGKNLPTVSFAADDELKVGEWVLAIGSPFGLDYSVSAGIVSAIGRSLPNENNENYVPFIQTDVAINPGNSGGPLFNLAGEVVGINSQIFTNSGGSIGLSFAIPSSLAKQVVKQLKAKGSVSRGWLGVGIQDVDKDLARSFGLDKPRGTLINYLEEGGPAEQAGIKEGDIIIEFNGRQILSSGDLPHVVGLMEPGSKAKVKLIRRSKEKSLVVKVGSLDAQGAMTEIGQVAMSPLGLSVEALDQRFARRWHLRGGVIVSSVDPSGVAARSHIMVGDVITAINGYSIKDVDDFDKVVAKLPKKASIPVRVVREGRPGYVAIRID